MQTKLKFRREIDDMLAENPPFETRREGIVFKLLTPEEVDLVGGGDEGSCTAPGGGSYTQTGGSFSQSSGGNYTQSGGSYNMTCPQPSGPR